ncbi:MAG: GyrI-like domain-containing protein [Candidatus Lokiarchaeota archaeon]|nr:GyrI-like domain-containing protein [Candidatus Lokiarchaeota archaeon]
MEPIIIDEKEYKILGCVYYGDPFHSAKGWDPNNEIRNTWNRFYQLYKKYEEFLKKSKAGNEFGFEIHIEPGDYMKRRKFHIFVGIEVKNLDFFPLDMFYKALPKTKYLFFSTEYKGKGCDFIFSKWIPESDYEQSYPYIIQSYSPERWKGEENQDSLMDWYIPIKKIEMNKNDF